MESIEDIAMQIKATFEDIEQFKISKILNCEDCSYEEKTHTLLEVKKKLFKLINDIDKFEK